MHGNTKLFCYRNTCFFNQRATGDLKAFATREARDTALTNLREYAVKRGLSKSASTSGIYPVEIRASRLSDMERDELEMMGNTSVGEN